jgi:type VI secretion system secreted protein Hcp
MKKRMALCLCAALAAVFLGAGPLCASEDIHVYITGQKQGSFGGDSTEVVRGTNVAFIEAFGLKHTVQVPLDASTGLPAGAVSHGQITFTKPIDKTTPKLYAALCGMETLTTVTIKFYRPSPTAEGTTQQYHTMTLKNAYLTRIENANGYDPATYYSVTSKAPQMENVSICYQTISWWEVNGGTFQTSRPAQ